jgi:(+)-pinoresinol hydroxylase
MTARLNSICSALVLALVTTMCVINPARAGDAVNAAPGKAAFDRWCLGCHEALPGRGWDPPAGTFVLQQRGVSPADLESRTDLSAQSIRALVRSGINIMPPTRKTELSDKQLDELAAYLTRNNKP